MKKLINTAFIYAIVGMVAGVFYREFTKIIGFTGLSNLSVLHTRICFRDDNVSNCCGFLHTIGYSKS